MTRKDCQNSAKALYAREHKSLPHSAGFLYAPRCAGLGGCPGISPRRRHADPCMRVDDKIGGRRRSAPEPWEVLEAPRPPFACRDAHMRTVVSSQPCRLTTVVRVILWFSTHRTASILSRKCGFITARRALRDPSRLQLSMSHARGGVTDMPT